MNVALKLAIIKTGLTQRVIAKRVGLSEDRLSDIVRGHEARPIEQAALAQTLGESVAKLFSPGSAAPLTSPDIKLRDLPIVEKILRDVATCPEASPGERVAIAAVLVHLRHSFGLDQVAGPAGMR